MQIYSRYNNNEFWENIYDIEKKMDLWEAEAILSTDYITDDTKSMAQFNAVATFYEGIGVLLQKKLIDIALVRDLMSQGISEVWESMEPVIRRQREVKKDDSIFKGFEYVYDKVKKPKSKK
jgi:hypothetical protein